MTIPEIIELQCPNNFGKISLCRNCKFELASRKITHDIDGPCGISPGIGSDEFIIRDFIEKHKGEKVENIIHVVTGLQLRIVLWHAIKGYLYIGKEFILIQEELDI